MFPWAPAERLMHGSETPCPPRGAAGAHRPAAFNGFARNLSLGQLRSAMIIQFG